MQTPEQEKLGQSLGVGTSALSTGEFQIPSGVSQDTIAPAQTELPAESIKPAEIPAIATPMVVTGTNTLEEQRNSNRNEAANLTPPLPVGQAVMGKEPLTPEQSALVSKHGVSSTELAAFTAGKSPQSLETAIAGVLIQKSPPKETTTPATAVYKAPTPTVSAAPATAPPKPAAPAGQRAVWNPITQQVWNEKIGAYETVNGRWEFVMGEDTTADTGAAGIMKTYQEGYAKTGQMSDAEVQSITSAGKAAAAQYEAPILKAREEKRQGMAKGLIRGGQAGGFMNTQIAGVGAFAQTEGGTFVGAGGLLERQREEYSYTIAQLESAQIAARAKAEEMQRMAIVTGKKEDLQALKDQFNMAMAIEEEGRAKANAFLDQTLKLNQIKQLETQDAMETLDAIAGAGMSYEDLPQEYVKGLEGTLYNGMLPSGWLEGYFDTRKSVVEAKNQEEQLASATIMMDFLDKVGAGGYIDVGDYRYTYQGRNEGDYTTGVQSDKSTGETYQWELNKKTGEKNITYIGNFPTGEGWATQKMSNGDLWAVNPITGQSRPFYASQGQRTLEQLFPTGSTLQELYPEGTQSPFRDESDPYQGQCAALCNDIYNCRLLGSSYNEKYSALQDYRIENMADVDYGDTLLFTAGNTGHVAFVENTGIDETKGKRFFQLFESNYQGNGVITHGRLVYEDDPTLKMAANVPTPNLPSSGSDARTSGILNAGREIDSKMDELLSPSEAKELGIAYGTTRGQAALMNIVPGASAAFGNIPTPTFDEFTAEYQKGLGMSVAPEEIQNVYKKTVAVVPNYIDASANISLGLTGDKGKLFMTNVRNQIESGNYIRAQDSMKKAAIDGTDTTTAQQVRGREQSMDALKNIRKELTDYIKAGGNVGIFSGGSEEIARKVGAERDAARRSIGNKMALALIDYRKAVSGAAFTESEGAAYKALFPEIMKGENLNFTTIDSLLSAFNSSNETFYSQQFGQENYEAIFGK